MKKALLVVLGIAVLLFAIAFVFAYDNIEKREVSDGVYEYYTFNELNDDGTEIHTLYTYLDDAQTRFRFSFIVEQAVNDYLVILPNTVFIKNERLPSNKDLIGYVVPQHGAIKLSDFSNPVPVKISSNDILYGINNEPLGVRGYTFDINALNLVRGMSTGVEFFYNYFSEWAPDFSNIDGFISGVEAVGRTLIIPLVSIVAIVKTVSFYVGLFGGGFAL